MKNHLCSVKPTNQVSIERKRELNPAESLENIHKIMLSVLAIVGVSYPQDYANLQRFGIIYFASSGVV